MKKPFPEWFKELETAFRKFWGGSRMTINPDDWRGYYDDDYSPEDAVRMDASYAEEA